MQISNDFRISLPPDEAYELLLDLDRVAPCMPGAELGPGLDDGSRAVTVKVKLGPMRFTYEGSVRVAEQDPAERRAVLVGAARDAKTQAAAEARIAMSVRAADGGSSVASSSDIQLTGRAAQMGESVIASVVAQLLADMAANLERQIAAEAAPAAPERAAAPPPAPAPRNDLRAGRLVLAVVRSWFRRLVRRGGAATR